MKEKQKMKLVYAYDLKEGQVKEGIVKSIQPYGAFIEIEKGIIGLLHIENISIARIKTPAERFKIGQKVNIMIKSIESDTGRITLSYKELLRNMARKCKFISRRRYRNRNCKRNRKE